MRKLAFSRLLLILIALPLLAMAVFATMLSWQSWSRYGELVRASSLLRLAVATGRLGGLALPAEGGASRDAITGGDRTKLDAARKLTDQLYRGVRDAAAVNLVKNPKTEGLLARLETRMGELTKLRQQIDTKAPGLTPAASTAVVAPTAGLAADFVGAAAAVTGDAVLAQRVFALYATQQFNETALVQRARGAALLQTGKTSPEETILFIKAVGLNETFEKLFNDYGLPDVVKQYGVFDAQYGRELKELRQAALKANGTPAPEAQAKRWTEIMPELTKAMNAAFTGTADRISAEADAMVAQAWRSTMTYVGVSLGITVLLLVMSFLVMRDLRGLLGGLATAVKALSERKLDITVPSVERADEIGVLARAAESFRDNLARVEALEAERRQTEQQAAAQRKADMQRLADRFEAAVGQIVHKVSSSATQLEAAASTLTQTAETTQQLSGVVAGASEQASGNVQSVAAATDQLTASVEEISRQVQASSRIAGEAVRQAEQTDTRIGALSEAAGRIGDVVKLITAIAEQTNLLALNATIEAARAGEAGRGFAVVASEVKSLAMQTAKATDEIGQQIASMQSATQESVSAIKEISGTIGRVAEIASTIAAAVEQQGAATSGIARNVQDAARGTTHVAQTITEVNRGANQTGAASGQVLSSARALATEGNKLKQEVDNFLATVRAA